MSNPPPEFPKPPARLHTVHVLVATVASIISIIGGIYSLKMTLFQNETPAGVLEGVVRDERLAKPLRLATVEIVDPAGQVMSTLATGDDGSYRVKNLKEGNYQVKVVVPLHQTEMKNVVIQKTATSTVDFSLRSLSPEIPFVPAVPTFTTPAVVPKVSERVPAPYSIPDIPRVYQEKELPYAGVNPAYPPPTPADETANQAQPSGTDLLVKTGTVLLEEFINQKAKKRQAVR